ncbi:glycosyltransferase [Roseateles violae]|uniref:Glycosyltransferase n=1 Tax=Roseateles violae TaxID=3058042 RepID=A0ABT8DTY3_9BURK|nr:glycosyltransferase [Pelomonas sp. PFR6]MDN3919784.1 glycosyltransferase [Pelomonas sp. PFR6]
MPPFRLCLVVIARDEAPRIARLLDSLRPWVDEMLVLDTGSVDATPQIAAAHGARVEHFRWCEDFSAARNRALELAAADWHLVLDAEEWLIAGGETLQALRELPPDFVGCLSLRDEFHDEGQRREVSQWLSRLLPGAVRYAGRVHEQPQHRLALRQLELLIGHDGYQPERLAAKQGRNRALLLQALQAAPGDAYLHYQLGKDCAVYEEHEPAEAAFARAAELAPDDAPWWTDLVVRRIFGLKRLKRHEAAIAFAEPQMLRCAESPDFFFALGDLLLDFAADEPARGEALLPLIEQAWRACLDLGERPEQAGAVAGRGSHLAARNLALLLDATGREAEASALRAAHPRPA